MKKIATVVAAAGLALAGASWSDGSAAAADWSSSRTPSDECARTVKASKFSALAKLTAGRSARGMLSRKPMCGGNSYPQIMQIIPDGHGNCITFVDQGPNHSPRYTTYTVPC